MDTALGRRLGKTGVAVLASLLVVARDVEAQCHYDVTIIQAPECPPFGFPPTIGMGISEPVDGGLPNVVGYYQSCVIGPHTAFLWRGADGQFITLDTPPGTGSSEAYDISGDGRQIVGKFDIPGDGLTNLGFVLQDGKWTTILPSGDGLFAGAEATNELRQVAGYRDHDEGMYGFLWDQGAFTDILPTQRGQSLARGLNHAAEVVGYMNWAPDWNNHAFLWADGQTIDLGVIPGGFTAVGGAINNCRQILISGHIQEDKSSPVLSRSFLWDKGQWTDLGVLPGFDRCSGWDLSDDGTAVGVCSMSANPNVQRGFVWKDGLMRDLNDLIPSDAGLLINWGTAVTNGGQITGRATSSTGVVAFLLTPIQPPLGDLDSDCAIGISDLLILLSNWGPCPPNVACPADLDGDGTVGILDLLTLLANWSWP